jgi:O-acetyl-ADP-ribose deacetylase (regulator of RNase III)
VYGSQNNSADLLRKCYTNSMKLAVENNLKTIAFPAISCGVYGYPIHEACRIAMDTVIEFIAGHPSIQKVIFVLFSDHNLKVYQEYFTALTDSDRT